MSIKLDNIRCKHLKKFIDSTNHNKECKNSIS